MYFMRLGLTKARKSNSTNTVPQRECARLLSKHVLSLVQSAMSLQMRVGEDLFIREGRWLILNDAEQLVQAYADNIFGLGQEMLERLEGRSAGIARLRVGTRHLAGSLSCP